MANIRAPFGFAPTQTLNWKRYFIPQSDQHAYRVDDCVVTSGGSDASGVLAVTLNPGNLPARGLIIAVEPADPRTGRDANLVRLTVPKVKKRDYYVWVLDDPILEFTIQDDGLFPLNLIAANVGKACNFNPAEAAGTDLSTAVLMSSTFATGSIVQVLGLYQYPGNVIGAFATWRCRFRLHELSAESSGVTFDDLGGPAAVTTTRQFIASKWVNKVGYSVLITGASTNARNNNEYLIATQSSYSRGTTGLVQFDCLLFPDAMPGRRIKIAHDNYPRILALLTVVSATDLGNGKTRITAQEVLFGMPPRPAVGGGNVPNGIFVCHDMQASPSEMDWVTKTNMKCGAVLDVTNMAIGGSVPADWLDPELQAYLNAMVAAQGPFDLHIWDGGYGNAITGPTASSEAICATIVSVGTFAVALSKDSIFHGSAGGRPGGDDNLVSNPWLTTDFTTLQRVNHYLRQFITTLFQTCEFGDLESAFQRYSLRGTTDAPDLVAGLVSNRLVDSGGIHFANAGNDVVSEVFSAMIIPKIRRFRAFNACRPDFVYRATTPDVGGRYVPGGIVGWKGACATAIVAVAGVGNIGTAFTGVTVAGSGFNHNMAAAIAVEKRETEGMRLRLDFTDTDPATTGGALLQLKISSLTFGGVTYTITQLLNDPKFSGQVDAWLKWAVYGFVPDSVAYIEGGIYGHTASGTREIAAFMTNKGANGAFGAQRGWTQGFAGPMRAGNTWFDIPQTEVYDDGYILLQVQGTPGLGMGNMVLEVDDFCIAARQALV